MIYINLKDNHNFGCNSVVIGRCDENKAETFEIVVPEDLQDKWLYIDFEKADGTKFKTPRIDIANGKAYYDITNNLTDLVGDLKVDIIFQDSDNLVWKTFTKKYKIVESICATNEIAEENPDFITDAQRVVDEANNLALDVSKTGTVSTVTITKKDGTTESVEINDGEKGDTALTVNVGTTTTGEAGTNADVVNVGTNVDLVLDFTIPRGNTGEQGIQGETGAMGPTGPQGEQGIQGPIGNVSFFTFGIEDGSLIMHKSPDVSSEIDFYINTNGMLVERIVN